MQPFCPTGPGRLREAPCKTGSNAASIAPEKGPRSAPTPHSTYGIQSSPKPTMSSHGALLLTPVQNKEMVLAGSCRVAFLAFLAAFPTSGSEQPYSRWGTTRGSVIHDSQQLPKITILEEEGKSLHHFFFFFFFLLFN